MQGKLAIGLLIAAGNLLLGCGFQQSVTQVPSAGYNVETPYDTLSPSEIGVYATVFPDYPATNNVPTGTAIPKPISSPTGPLSVKLYLVAIDDNGKSGQKIGCGDSLVAVNRDIPRTGSPLKDTLTALFAMKDQYYGQSGLYNAVYQSDLKVDGISSHDGAFRVDLSGKMQLGGECDNPRFAAQITQTIMQFSTVKSVQVNINGKSLDSVLSER